MVQKTALRKIYYVSIGLIMAFLVSAPAFACSWDYAIWMIRSKNADPLYLFVRNGKVGYIDRTGKIIIEPQLDLHGNYGGEFHDGLLDESGYGSNRFIDSAGNRLRFSEIDKAWSFSEGLAVAWNKENQWGYINTKGEFVIPPRFASYPEAIPSSFSEGLARVELKGRYGYLDRKGDFAITPTFIYADDFHDDIARVVVEGLCLYVNPDSPCPDYRILPRGTKEVDVPPCKYTYVDRTGRMITEQRFDGAKDFSEGLAPVLIRGQWGYIDKQGQVAIAPLYDDAEPFSDGMGKVKKDGKYGYVDHSGRPVILPQFTYAEDFTDGLAVVGHYDSTEWEKSDFIYINKEGKPAFAGHFMLASHFYKGLAHVRLKPEAIQKKQKSRDFAYIDTNGKIIFRYTVADQ